MSEIGEFWKEVKPELQARNKEKRACNRENSAKILLQNEVEFTTHNNGAHLIVKGRCGTVDFWPGTGRWQLRSGRSGFGVKNLINIVASLLDEDAAPASQSELIKALGVKLPEAREAAFSAADGNDGTNWGLLDELCPAGMTVGEFIDLLCAPGY